MLITKWFIVSVYLSWVGFKKLCVEGFKVLFWGGSMVKYTGKMLVYGKIMIFFGEMPKSSSNMLFKLDIFHVALYYWIKYSYIEYQYESSKTYH